jgi:hypothetical protein
VIDVPATVPQGRRLDHVPLGELRPHPRNPRTHKPAELRKSYDRFGFTNPIIVCERVGVIAAGHGRWELLCSMKADAAPPPDGVIVDEAGEWRVPVIRGWASKDDAELIGYVIADNRHTELGHWEHAELAPMLTAIDAGPGLSGTGFTPKDLKAMMEPAEAPKAAVGIENDYGQRADRYRNKQLRSIIFDYPLDAYEFVAQAALSARATFGVETNAELFVAMLRQFDQAHPA